MRSGPSMNIASKVRNLFIAGLAVVTAVGPDLLHARPLSQDEQRVHQCALDAMRGERLNYEPHQRRDFVVNEGKDDVLVKMVSRRPGAGLIVNPVQQGAHAEAFAQRVRATVSGCGMGGGR